MGKKVKLGIGIITIALVGSLVTTALAGSNADPGSINDPIVTKSYVDEQINLIKQQGIGQTSSIVVEKLDAGNIIIAHAGTELILRGGTAVIYGENTNGIPDVTGGEDLKVGSNVPKNHQLIIPRDDGRGLKITKGPAYVMIRGSYEIK